MNSQSISKKIVTEDKNFLSLESVEKQNFQSFEIASFTKSIFNYFFPSIITKNPHFENPNFHFDLFN